jgi:hypothetical protein
MIFILKNCINNTWENHQIPISSFHLHIENTMFSHKRQYCSHWIWWHKLPHFQSSIHRFSSAKQSNLFVQTKLTQIDNPAYQWHQQASTHVFNISNSCSFLVYDDSGNSDHGQYLLLTSLPQCVVCGFERVQVWLIIAMHPHFQFGWSQLRAAPTSAQYV